MPSVHGRCLSKDAFKEVSESYKFHTAEWTNQALKEFESIVKQDGFPCLFGKKSVGAESFKLLFVREQHDTADLIGGVGGYIEQVKSWTLKYRINKPLIVFFEKRDFPSLAEEQRYAWSVLQQLHERDPGPWPDGISDDMQSEQWSFSFMGMPLFINMSFSQHRQMKSRNLGAHIVFVINPRENFDHVAAGSSQSGQRIRERIRSRSEAYNQGVVSQALGFFGERGSLELKQYQLEEPGSLSHEQCPFHMNLKHLSTKASKP